MAFAEKLRAKVGAVLLDVVRPGWAREIDTNTLDLADCEVCVLGQLFGRYEEGCAQLFAAAADTTNGREPEESAADRGGFRTDGNYAKLTAAWKNEIRNRRRRG